MKRLHLVPVFLALSLTIPPAEATTEKQPIVPDRVIELFNGKDLSNFYTWLADHRRPEDDKYEDPDRVFTVVERIDDAPAIRISGQHWGGLITNERYADYRLVVEYRWGLTTWGPRVNRAKDSGILLHCQGQDGNSRADFRSPWMRSVEFQIIEGGTGDILLVGGHDSPEAPRVSPSMTVTVLDDSSGGRPYWHPAGEPREFVGGRINWYGRDPKWTGDLGFRGHLDLEEPGQWSLLEAVCSGDSVIFYVNGVRVNEGTNSSLREGKILFQSEGAEIFFRKIELHPLK